ncbi:MAG TPA: nitroreductase family protein, partial [Flavisolibacter sp.]|nr:nitroreductase family protein [Flavisolibacter sp.]
LRTLAMNQPQVTDASHLLLLCSRKTVDSAYFDRLIEQEKEQRDGESVLESFKPMAMAYIGSKEKEALREWLAEQVYIALGFLLLGCAMMQIDACPIEGFDHSKVTRLLNLRKQGVECRVLVAIGYRPERQEYIQQPKIRWPKEEVVITV